MNYEYSTLTKTSRLKLQQQYHTRRSAQMIPQIFTLRKLKSPMLKFTGTHGQKHISLPLSLLRLKEILSNRSLRLWELIPSENLCYRFSLMMLLVLRLRNTCHQLQSSTFLFRNFQLKDIYHTTMSWIQMWNLLKHIDWDSSSCSPL